ncbi:MAG: hypothetical protein ACR2QK_17010 [Acidimicrobiales bacterium]
MLDPLDEFPIHQTPVSVTENGLGTNAYDRYFFNGYNDDGSVFFALALGVYPNRRIIDGALCVVIDGVQHSVFATGRLGTDRRRTAIGPISIEVVEPMSELKIVVDHPEVAIDATFRARTPPIEEPRFSNHHMSLGVFDYTRYTQFGHWSGSATAAGSTIDVTGSRGCRDRSWGQRGGRGPDTPPADPQFFWLWTPINFEDGGLHLDVNENSDGSRWHEGGFSAPPLTGDVDPWLQPVERMARVDHRLELEQGTRWIRAAELMFGPWRGDDFTVELTPLTRFQMSGVGYGHPRFRHGSWVGDGVVETERLVLADVDPTSPGSFHVQQVVEAQRGDDRGVGVLELMVIGPHEGLGLQQMADVAPGG